MLFPVPRPDCQRWSEKRSAGHSLPTQSGRRCKQAMRLAWEEGKLTPKRPTYRSGCPSRKAAQHAAFWNALSLDPEEDGRSTVMHVRLHNPKAEPRTQDLAPCMLTSYTAEVVVCVDQTVKTSKKCRSSSSLFFFFFFDKTFWIWQNGKKKSRGRTKEGCGTRKWRNEGEEKKTGEERREEWRKTYTKSVDTW